MRDRLVLVFTFTLIFNVAAFGQNWTNPSGGSWGTPSNWSNDGTPTSPVFDLASPAPGYTTSLPTTYNFPSGFAVQTDSVTADLNGNGFSTSALNIASTTGQTGSLTLIGPGTVTLNNSQNNTSGNLDVGDQGGTGQLVVNDATISSQGTGSSHFTADGLVVENRFSSLLSTPSVTITDATFNDGSLSAGENLTLDQISLSNASRLQTTVLFLGSATLDDSTISASTGAMITGVVTLSDQAGMTVNNTTISGTVNVLAGTHLNAPSYSMNGGTLSVELNALVSAPISRSSSPDNGTLDFTLQNGFNPTIGEQFTIFNSISLSHTGTFATINLPILPAGGFWNTSNLYTNGTISVVPEPVSLGIFTIGIVGLSLRRRNAVPQYRS